MLQQGKGGNLRITVLDFGGERLGDHNIQSCVHAGLFYSLASYCDCNVFAGGELLYSGIFIFFAGNMLFKHVIILFGLDVIALQREKERGGGG